MHITPERGAREGGHRGSRCTKALCQRRPGEEATPWRTFGLALALLPLALALALAGICRYLHDEAGLCLAGSVQCAGTAAERTRLPSLPIVSPLRADDGVRNLAYAQRPSRAAIRGRARGGTSCGISFGFSESASAAHGSLDWLLGRELRISTLSQITAIARLNGFPTWHMLCF